MNLRVRGEEMTEWQKQIELIAKRPEPKVVRTRIDLSVQSQSVFEALPGDIRTISAAQNLSFGQVRRRLDELKDKGLVMATYMGFNTPAWWSAV